MAESETKFCFSRLSADTLLIILLYDTESYRDILLRYCLINTTFYSLCIQHPTPSMQALWIDCCHREWSNVILPIFKSNMKSFNKWQTFVKNRVLALRRNRRYVAIENCERVLPFVHYQQQKTLSFDDEKQFVWKKKCDISNEHLRDTNDSSTKYCTSCCKLVYNVKDAQELDYHVSKGHCVTMNAKPTSNGGDVRYMDVRGEIERGSPWWYRQPPPNFNHALTYHPNFNSDYVHDLRHDVKKHLIIEYESSASANNGTQPHGQEMRHDLTHSLRRVHEVFKPMIGSIMIDEALTEITRHRKCRDREQKLRIQNTLSLLQSKDMDILPAFTEETRNGLTTQLTKQLNRINQNEE